MLSIENIISKMNNILNERHIKDPDFSRRGCIFFVSHKALREIMLEFNCGGYSSLKYIEIFGCKVLGVSGLADDEIYLAK